LGIENGFFPQREVIQLHRTSRFLGERDDSLADRQRRMGGDTLHPQLQQLDVQRPPRLLRNDLPLPNLYMSRAKQPFDLRCVRIDESQTLRVAVVISDLLTVPPQMGIFGVSSDMLIGRSPPI